MFRRFMIVCWVLFLILGSVGLVGQLQSWRYQAQAEQIVGDANAKIARQVELGVEPVTPWGHDLVVSTPESMEAAKRSGEYAVLANFAGIPALLLLLWNLVWHTSHWIWMGRKAELTTSVRGNSGGNLR